MQQYIGFKLGRSEYTIPILKVREIINTPSITRLPKSPYYMKGIINLRGRIVPVVDLKELVSSGEGASRATKVIVLSTERSTFGILVDEITSVINIDEANIELPEGFMHDNMERVEGVAKFDDRLVILLDTDKLVDEDEVRAFGGGNISEIDTIPVISGEPEPIERQVTAPAPAPIAAPAPKPAPAPEPAPPSPAPEPAHLSAGQEAKEILHKKFGETGVRSKLLNTIVDLLDTMSAHDYEKADLLLSKMVTDTSEKEGELYNEIGRVTRKLHDSISDFRQALDPRIKMMANEDVPNAVDNLQFVMKKTEEAANKTMTIVEKYLGSQPEYTKHLQSVIGTPETMQYLERFNRELFSDLTDILVAQEFQDITGQTIRKVIDLVNAVETELVSLIATFGVKIEEGEAEVVVPEIVVQSDVEDLLKEFGF